MVKLSQIKKSIFHSLIINNFKRLFNYENEILGRKYPYLSYLLLLKNQSLSEYTGSVFINFAYLKFLRISKMLC